MQADYQKLQYINTLFGTEDELLEKVRQSAPKHLRHMQLSKSELQLLSVIIKISGAEQILEIGTFVGASTIGIAQILPRGGVVHTIEKSENFFAIAKQNFENTQMLGNKIVPQRADALDALRDMDLRNIEAIFIDAAKAEYPAYLNAVYQKLRSGVLIIADNTLLFDAVWNDKQNDKKCKKMRAAMREFNTMLSDRSLFEPAFIPTDSGMTIGIKK